MIRRAASSFAASSIVATVLLLVVAVPAARAVPELAISPPSGEPGAQMTAIVVGFAPGATITLLWKAQPGAVLETATADASGSAVINFQIPAGEAVGPALVRACADAVGCPPGTEFADATIDVLTPSFGAEGGGGSWLPLLLIAFVALVLGQVTRRRWAQTSETFKPPPRKTHDHEFEGPPEVGRKPWQDREP